jgi:shikimate 5-dehydrogenase
MNINKDTKIFGSFSLNAGNNGNIFFNNNFQNYNIDAIYKSFSIENIENAVKAARCLNFCGFAVSMPFKKEVINFVDDVSDEVKEIGACNTIVNNNGKLIAYNTDYIGVRQIIKNKIEDSLVDKINEINGDNTKLEEYWDNISINEINDNIKSKLEKYYDYVYILGDGGMANATKYALRPTSLKYNTIKRNTWNEIKTLKNKIIINCTPVKNIKYDKSNIFIDTLPDSEDGKYIHYIQAKKQFYLYTGIEI